jgi:hypothetical protein
MKKLILGLVAFSAIAASAATARLGSATLDADDRSATIDVRNLAEQDEVTLAVKGSAVSIGEVVVVYRTGNGFGKYVSTKFRVNKVVQSGGAITLELPSKGYPIRRIELEATAHGFQDASIVAYGSN